LELTGKHVLVIGIKRSGLAAIELLRKRGARVRAMDAQPLARDERSRFEDLKIPVVLQRPENLSDQGRDPDLIVVSPAVPYDLPILAEARQRGTEVIDYRIERKDDHYGAHRPFAARMRHCVPGGGQHRHGYYVAGRVLCR
jgi:UDP-N-acetylmuramoylalanine-D-glutamate ligase